MNNHPILIDTLQGREAGDFPRFAGSAQSDPYIRIRAGIFPGYRGPYRNRQQDAGYLLPFNQYRG